LPLEVRLETTVELAVLALMRMGSVEVTQTPLAVLAVVRGQTVLLKPGVVQSPRKGTTVDR
jgi:hypothetical protein